MKIEIVTISIFSLFLIASILVSFADNIFKRHDEITGAAMPVLDVLEEDPFESFEKTNFFSTLIKLNERSIPGRLSTELMTFPASQEFCSSMNMTMLESPAKIMTKVLEQVDGESVRFLSLSILNFKLFQDSSFG